MIKWLSNLSRRDAFILLMIAFLTSILIRLPNLKRPLSKHHEFLPATVLINAASWKQGGGGEVFNYTPVMNYQNKGDKVYEKGPNIDKDGNILYLSLGPGWYIIPYWFLNVFDASFRVSSLRIVNLFFNFISIILCFFLLNMLVPESLKRRYLLILTGCVALLFSPGILWYFGNGYTHTAVMLPFLFTLLLVLVPMIQHHSRITIGRLSIVFVLFVLGLYMDWFAAFVGISTIGLCLFRTKSNKKYLLLTSVIIAALSAGVLLIFWQYSSYAGYNVTKHYWELRFFARSAVSKDADFLTMITYLPMHYVTAYLPLLSGIFITTIIALINKQYVQFAEKEIIFLCVYGVAILMYHIGLLNWSYEHEFSVVPACLMLVYLFIRYLFFITSYINKKWLIAATVLFFLMNVAQYYYINPPGGRSLNGMPYSTYETFGNQLRNIDKDVKIFMQMQEGNPMIEYYAKRNITNAANIDEAKKMMLRWNTSKAVWIEQNSFTLEKIIAIQ
ncbi:MAG: hypothetical protein QM802_08035 [Agriterribacter sp.]